ncbi:MAG: ATP-binding protein, partial [Actinomycetota bacterium]|nr:ATP-binding protein [Actinomycetota bacterium]
LDVALTVSPVRDAEGNVAGASTIARDVTDRKRQAQLLATIFETSPDIIAMITSGLELVYVNQAAQELLGYGFDELFGRDSLHWVHPDDLQVAAELLQAAFGAGEPAQGRLRVKNTAEDWMWLDIRMRSMGQGSDTAVVIARDITEQVRLEESLKDARDLADRANLAKSEFLSRMSHELRTPLNAVLGFAQLLEMDPLTEEQKQGTTEILKAGKHLLDLIDEVLDISRIEAGRLRLSLEPVEVGQVVDECVSLLTPQAAEEGVTVHVDRASLSNATPHVTADRQRLKQVMLNLMSNAIKYNRQHGNVEISCDRREHGRLKINVTDTGNGIPADRMEQVFTPFDRLGAEGSGVQGTGLGLALSKRLVDAMGGTITVVSELGRGSTFSVELAIAPDPSRTTDEEGVSEELTETVPSRSQTILYIEDNLSNLKLVERLLDRRPGLNLMSAMQGGIGVTLARDHQPSLILLDLDLPDIPGEEVLGRLHSDPRTAELPVVVISADATPGQMKRLLATGARAYLTKPFDVRRFFEVVDEFCPLSSADV